MITGSIPAPRHPATVLLVALTPLAGCDENATTAPEEPPRERAVEVQEPVPDVDVALVRFYSWTYMGDGTDVFQYRDGAIYAIDFLGDTIPFDTGRFWRSGRPLPTHETVNWNDFTICTDCELELAEAVRFGDADGPGTIESVAPKVTWNARLGYVVVGPTYLQVFNDDGRFVRRIGREGDGPGEFSRVIDAHVVGNRLVALDDAQRAWSIFNLAGKFIERLPYGHATGPFVPVGGSRVVVVAMDQSPEVAGLPLHLADIDSGVPSRHFGSWYEWEDTPYADNVQGSVVSGTGTVWWGAAGSPRVQEWSLDDELLRVVDGELPWFPEVTEVIDPTREPPSTLLRSLALDGREHLWMTTRTADPQWREVELERAPEGYRVPPARRAEYMDTRLDIFDLEGQRHIGRFVWDSPYARLLDLGGEPAVSIVEYTEDNGLQVVIYRVDLRG